MPTAERTWRAAGLVAFAAVAAAVAYGLFYTPFGRTITHDPTAAADAVRRCVGDRPVVAPLAFVAGYVVLATLCLPIWWLQVLAGVAFGLWGGGVLCVVGSATGGGGDVGRGGVDGRAVVPRPCGIEDGPAAVD